MSRRGEMFEVCEEETFDESTLWVENPGYVSNALDVVWGARWVVGIQLVVAIGGIAWLSSSTIVPLHDAILSSSPDRLSNSSRAWLSDMATSGASLEMIEKTPDIARAMQQVAIARGKVETPVPADAAIATAARQIGYIPAVTLANEGGGLSDPVVSGSPQVISGDSFKLDGHAITLDGAHAPSSADSCISASGSIYDCASWAKTGLETMLEGSVVSCRITGAVGDGTEIGRCEILGAGFGGEHDIARIGVKSGLLFASGEEDRASPYEQSERAARTTKLGLWSGKYTPASH